MPANRSKTQTTISGGRHAITALVCACAATLMAGCQSSAVRHAHIMDIPPQILAAEAALRKPTLDHELVEVLRGNPQQLFDSLDRTVNEGNGDKLATNDSGSLAWSESHIMLAYTTMYEATGDIHYLHKLVDHADAVLAVRDDRRGVTDYRGVSGACWRTFRFQVPPRPYCYVVHSGAITYPMARFAAIVAADRSLQAAAAGDGTTLGEKARQYIRRVKETIAAHEWQWVDGPLGGEGHYRLPIDAPAPLNPGRPLPWNQQNAMGRTLLAMYDATGDSSFLDKAEKLARLYRRFIWRHGDSFVWQIRNDLDITSLEGCGEDISHAAINVDFAVLAHKAGIVFTEEDLTAFAATFRQNVMRPDGTTWATVTGCGPIGEYDDSIGRWLNVTPWDNGTIYAAAMESMREVLEGRAKPRAGYLSSVANLIRWASEVVRCPGKANAGHANAPTKGNEGFSQ